MADKSSTPESTAWNVEERIQLMSRRYEFSCYAETREFLDRLEKLSESENYYPDLSFGRTYVNVSIKGRNNKKLSEEDYGFSEKVNLLLNDNKSRSG